MTARGNPTAVSVQALDDYRLLVTFENEEKKIFDVKPMLEGKENTWFGELYNHDYFQAVRIGGGSVEWPDEQDICPDCLYEDSIPFIYDNDSSAPACS